MHGHDGCGCGHGAETQLETQPHGQAADGEQLPQAGSCGDGCGCGHGPGLDDVETGVMQGFLSGLYASTLSREKLTEYLTTMSQADGSEFQGPASVLLDALEATPTDSRPLPVALLETVTGEPV